MICTAHPIFSGDQIEKNEMGPHVACMGAEERHVQGFGGGT